MSLHPAAPIRSAPPLKRPPDNVRGLIFMTLGFFCFGLTDMMAKVLTASMSPFEVVWFRQLGLFLSVVVLLGLRGGHILRTPHPVLQLLRGVAATGSACFFILALRKVPLADATAVTFIAPFLVTILGALLLREPVGPRRWIAVAIGFVGMLIVIRPGAGVFDPAIGFVVCAATMFGSRQLLSRMVAGDDTIATTVTYTSLTSFGLISIPLAFVWTTPDSLNTWLVIAGMTCFAAVGELFIIRGLDVGQAVVLAPVHYTILLWSTLYGYLIFADLPDVWTLTGCSIIVISGLYTVYRERVAAKKAR